MTAQAVKLIQVVNSIIEMNKKNKEYVSDQYASHEAVASLAPALIHEQSALVVEQLERQALGWSRSVMIIATAVGLMGIGAVMTYSASARVGSTAVSSFAAESLWKSMVFRQIMFVVGGLLTMVIVSRVPYRIWTAWGGKFALVGLIVAIGACGLVFVPGVGQVINGARRWIRLGGGLTLQPSELVKIMLPIFLATWMTRGVRRGRDGELELVGSKQTNIQHFFAGLVPIVVMIGLSLGIIGKEDFGTAALLVSVSGAMLLIGGARIWHLCLLACSAAPMFYILLHSRSHRTGRLMTFRNIWEDPQGAGYQVVQSLCTIASGGLYGRGLGRGFVKSYLPEARTDFIFSVICEELGMIGAIAVIALLFAFLWQCRLVVRDCADPMGKVLAFGIAMTFGIQAVMNIAVVTVSVPPKGISLPLVSAGGSGVIFLGVLVGVLASISRYGGLIKRG